jgi:DNA-binding transcriptional MerR regulator
MQKWHTQDVCRLTGVSARTLQHYDSIGLLKASMRLSNGYRVYSEADLARLQQILALKSFGFELSKIKEVLSGQSDMLKLLQMQKDFLQQKTQQFKEAIDILAAVIDDSKIAGSVGAESTLKLIGVYKMTKELEQSSFAKVFTKEQLKKFAEMPKPPEEEEVQYGKDWENLIAEVAKHLDTDPYSETGQAYAKQWMNLVDHYWSDQELKQVIWDCYLQNKFEDVADSMNNWPGIPQDVVHWIDKAVNFMNTRKKK